MKIQSRRRSAQWVWWVIGLIVVAAIGWFTYHSVTSPKTAQEEPAATTQEQKKAAPVAIQSNILTMGNVYFGRYINDWSMASPLKYAYPFSRLNEFDRSKYDAWIAGLECPTKAGVSMTSAEEDRLLQFNCSPEYLPEAAKWFTAFTLANNHTDNQGVDGFKETQADLDKNGIQYFGHYDPRALDDLCDVISLPVTIANDDKSQTKGALPVAMCGYHGVFRIPSEESMAVMEKYSKIMPVIAFPHMGVEYEPAPDQLKTSVYRALIDHGADMVLGDHPHWVQTTESYKGHLIVYSMGNFIFDQQDTSEVTRSAAIHILLQSDHASSAMLQQWLALGQTCKAYHDDCLQQAESEHLTKLPLTYKFGVVGTNDSDKIVKPATPAQQAAIEQRLSWDKTMSQLQAPYGSL